MPSKESLLKRTGTSQEKRHWVRLTKACNNHCLFCLDSDCQDGTSIDLSRAMDDISSGLRSGARRLILSGGEPTIHPQFLEIIERSTKIGYRWIQAISNGRRFAYPEFAARAVNAGLNEVTISVHGHDAALHDALTMVPGSFAQSVAGIKNLLRSGKCHVSVDVVMNSMNIEFLAAMIEKFAGMGVGEFDLLSIQPFGRAWENRHLMLEKEHSRLIKEGIRKAQELQCWVWTNRVPPQYLEGMEEMIQDPVKLIDDIGGRRELFVRNIKNGSLPDCRGEKCAYCVLEKYCRCLFDLLGLLGITESRLEANHDRRKIIVKIETTGRPNGIGFAEKLIRKYLGTDRPETLKYVIRKNSPQEAILKSADRISPGSSLILQCHEDPGDKIPLSSTRIKRAIMEPELIDLLSGLPDHCEKIIIARNKLDSSSLPPDLSGLAYLPCGDIAEELASGPDLKTITRGNSHLQMIDVPPCLSGNKSNWPAWPFLSTEWFDDAMLPDPVKFASAFIEEMNYTKRMQCRTCIHDRSCRGIHINYVRKFGYRALKPVHSRRK